MMNKSMSSLLIVSVLISFAAAAGDIIEPTSGDALKGARGFDVEADLRNDRPAFVVRVSVDQKDRIYEKGELMKVTVRSQRSGYLYLMYKQADGSSKCLFPNVYESDNRIKADEDITIPTSDQGFKLRCNAPFGEELLVAVVSGRPLRVEELGVQSLTKEIVTSVDLERFAEAMRKGMYAEGSTPAGSVDQWAEHSVRITTVPSGSRTPTVSDDVQRIGLFIGISEYRDSRIRDLSICHQDAKIMAAAMKEHGRLDAVGLLTNENATRENIKQAFRELKLKSDPGDELFIYWSGHGATCADTSGDEEDGLDELLIPYDGSAEDAEGTMILDDTLGRWIQELDGRKVAVILDACHSGGQATAGKGVKEWKDDDAEYLKGIGYLDDGNQAGGDIISDLNDGSDNSAADLFKASGSNDGFQDFFDNEYSRIKDIGQKHATMLFSSRSDQISAERRDNKASVMTYYLVQKILDSDSLTFEQAHEYLLPKVEAYMEDNFPGREQTPQLLPQNPAAEPRLR